MSRTCAIDEPHPTQLAQAVRFVAVIAWGLASIGGLFVLMRYANTAGPAAPALERWPDATAIERNETGATLVMFAHPHCPCTRASLAELEHLVAQCGGSVDPRIVFMKPGDAQAGWEQSDLWRTAQAIPGAHVVSDVDGEERAALT